MARLTKDEGAALVEHFRRYLRDHRLPVTRPRDLVAETVFHSEDHLSVEDIQKRLHERGEKVGTATVYRTLEVLLRSGLVVERDFGEGFKRFEAARGHPHHEHLLCSRCGRVTEFRDERLERMTMLIAQQYGYVRDGHKLVIEGLCAECRESGDAT